MTPLGDVVTNLNVVPGSAEESSACITAALAVAPRESLLVKAKSLIYKSLSKSTHRTNLRMPRTSVRAYAFTSFEAFGESKTTLPASVASLSGLQVRPGKVEGRIAVVVSTCPSFRGVGIREISV